MVMRGTDILYFLFKEKLRFGVSADFSLLIIAREEYEGTGHLMGTNCMLLIVQLPSHIQLFATPWTPWKGFLVLYRLLEFAQTHVH